MGDSPQLNQTQINQALTNGDIKLLDDKGTDVTEQGLPYTGKEVYPKCLQINGYQYKICDDTASSNNDYKVDKIDGQNYINASDQNPEVTDVQPAGTVRIRISATSAGTKGFASDVEFEYCYKIRPQLISTDNVDYQYTGNAEGYLVDENESIVRAKHLFILNEGDVAPTITYKRKNGTGNFEVFLNNQSTTENYRVFKDDKGEEPFAADEALLTGRTVNLYIKLDNYVTSGGSHYFPKQALIVRHASNTEAGLKINGTAFSDWHPAGPLKEPPTLTVPDNITFEKMENQEPVEGGYRVEVKGTDPECYGWAYSDVYTIGGASTDMATYLLQEKSGTKDGHFAVEYSEGEQTYIITQMDNIKGNYNVIEQGTNVLVSMDSGLVREYPDKDGYLAAIIDNGNVVSGATAGRARIGVTVNGKPGYLYYDVIRNLQGAMPDGTDREKDTLNSRLKINDPIDKKTKEKQDGNTYEFDKEKHEMLPQMYFQEEGGTAAIIKEDDYKVEYLEGVTEDNKGNITNSGTTSNCTNAGTIIMKITGKGGYEGDTYKGSGYYGTIYGKVDPDTGRRNKLTYKIARKSIDSRTYKTELKDPLDYDGTVYSYYYGAKQEDICNNARFINVNDSKDVWDLYGLDRGVGYDVRFIHLLDSGEDDKTLGENDPLEAGNKYRVEFEFKGNYITSSEHPLSCIFQITAYNWSDIEVGNVKDTCENAWCTSGSAIHHIYNGNPHNPDINLVYKGRPDLGIEKHTLKRGVEYTLTWSGNTTDAGEVQGTVELKGSKDKPKSVSFTIQPYPLKTEDVQFTEKDFTLNEDGSGWTYAYLGKDGIPQLTELELNKPMKKTLTNAGGFTQELGQLYTKPEEGAGWDPSQMNTENGYYIKITLDDQNYRADDPTDNNKRTMFVGPFWFEQRNLDQAKVTENNKVITYDSKYVTEEYKDDSDKLKELISGHLRGKTGDGKDNFQIVDFVTDTGETKLSLKNERTGAGDYEIISTVNKIKVDGSLQFMLKGINFYKGEIGPFTINVGKNIEGAMIRERAEDGKNNTHKIGFSKPEPDNADSVPLAILQNPYQDTNNSVDRYRMNFLKDGDTITTQPNEEPDASYTYLYYGEKNETSTKDRMYYGDHYRVDFGEPISKENGEDDALWYVISIRGIQGYYGTAHLKFKVEKKDLEELDCKVEILDQEKYIYQWDGGGRDYVPIPVRIRVWEKVGDKEEVVSPKNYYIDYAEKRTFNKEDAPSKHGDHYFTVIGQNEYKGSIKNQKYTILQRSLCKTPSTVSGSGLIGSINDSNFTLEMPLSYKYNPDGIEPPIKLLYYHDDRYGNSDPEPETLVEGEHYVCNVKNGKQVTDDTKTDGENPYVRFGPSTRSPGQEFTGEFDETITVTPLIMSDVKEESDCFIKLVRKTFPFTAQEVKLTNADIIVGRYLNDKKDDSESGKNKNWVEVDKNEYEINCTGNYYVTGGYTGDDQEHAAHVEVHGKYNLPSVPGIHGNYRDSMSADFIIQGSLAKEAKGTGDRVISKTEIDGHTIPYSSIGVEGAETPGMTVRFHEQEQNASPGEFVPRELRWMIDYDVYIEGTSINKLGEKKVSVGVYKDNGTKIRQVEPTAERPDIYFVGEQQTPIVIQGNLKGDETTVTVSSSEYRDDDGGDGSASGSGETYKKISIAIPDGKETGRLEDYIAITCGGKPLNYGEDKDYIFKTPDGTQKLDEPDMTPGTRFVTIARSANAAKEGEEYLSKEELTLEYHIKKKINSGSYDISDNVRENGVYPYNHGYPVIDLDKVTVSLKGAKEPLRQGKDYTIAFQKDGINRGEDAVVIHPIGNYAGDDLTIPFTIDRFNLREAYDNKAIRMPKIPDAVYTGENVFPKGMKPLELEVTTTSGAGVRTVKIYGKGDEDPDMAEEAYQFEAMPDQNNRDYSEGDTVTCILRGIGNYTGDIPVDYRILRKDITKKEGEESDVDFYTSDTKYKYQNGDSIRPVPEGKYNGFTLTGREDVAAGPGSFGKEVPFIYTYEGDTENVTAAGVDILITGNGNFTGTRRLHYQITPLPLADLDLTFADEQLVYDGQEQHPSFALSYKGKPIGTYDKTNGVKSDFISNVNVGFKNATDATKPGQLASVILSFDDKDKANSNYKDTKTATFAIQPASLEGHVAFMYHPKGEAGNIELESNLHLPWTGESVKPVFPIKEPTFKDTDLAEGEAGAIYEFAGKRNNGNFLKRADKEDAEPGYGDYTIAFKYVEPDSDDTDVKEGFGDAPDCTFAGKVKVTVTGINNYKDSASFWYYIGDDISADGSARLQTNTTVYNAQKQPPTVIVSGISRDKYNVARYKDEVKNENFISEKEFIDAATYYIRIEGNPSKGTYASKPITLTYTIQPRAISNSVVIDGFKKEYNYTGIAICPVGISVTDYIDRTKYKLTENEDYSLTYTNNINVGTATINVNGEGNFKGTAAARFAITSSMISGGSNGTPGGSVSNGSGQISGAVAVAPDDVRVTLDAGNAMYYTGKQLTPAVTISGMTQNTDYTVTYSNNVEVGTGVITITGMGNNTGTITKNFRIVAKLSDCKVTNIPDQQYTGSAVEPLITVTCGNSILTKDKDYTVSFVNNVEVGTATAMIRAAGNSNYIGSLEAKFNIGNNVGGFIVSGYAPTYPYTGSAITPAVTVESGSTRLQQGTDYTVSYENNVDAGSASIIVKGAGKYTGTQTVNFIIEPRSIQVCDTTEVEDKTYTGDAYTPSITVRDSGKVLQNGVDYTLTYSDNVNPGLATITIQGLSNNYTGTKKITFRIGGVAVSGLQVSAVNATSIKLKWQQQGYADGYQICNSKSKVVKTVNGSNDSTTVTDLKPGKTYKYKVRSYTTNSQGERSYSAASAVVTATTKLKTPAVTLKRKGTGRMRIKWTKSTNADGYEIFYKNTKSAKYRRIKKVDDVNTRICNVRGIKSGKKCYVRVRAYKKTGSTTLRSAMSKTKTIKVK